MININKVYQRVLAFANKEQRGYITPQEFNIFAENAQLEIFEQYFYDKNQFSRVKGNESEYSDMISNLDEKISIFESTAPINSAGEINAADFYRLGTVIFAGTSGTFGGGTIVEEVQQNEILYINKSPLASPTLDRPVYVRTGEKTIDTHPSITTGLTCTYVRIPTKPSWGYVVVSGRAMYDSSNTTHFELHVSEENELIYKILKFAGLSLSRDDLAKGGQGLESMQVQQEKQ